jgi:hypothetical protein
VGPYVPQVCARGAVLQCTVVLIEGATIEAGEEDKPPGPYWMIEVSANIKGMWTWTRMSVLSWDAYSWAATSFYRPRGGGLQMCRVAFCAVSWYRHAVLAI